MIDEQNFLNQPVKNDLGTYDNVRKITIGYRDDYTTVFLLDYPYFKENYKLIAKDLSKQQVLDADPKAIQKINFTGNLAPDRTSNTTMFIIIEKSKETILNFSQGSVKVLYFYFVLI